MKLTADTITDEQIRELLQGSTCMQEQIVCGLALTPVRDRHVQRYAARAHCAEILNNRKS